MFKSKSKSNNKPKLINQEELNKSRSFLEVVPDIDRPAVAEAFYNFCTEKCSHAKFIKTCNKHGLFFKCQTYYEPNTLEGLEGDDYISYIFESKNGNVFMKKDEKLLAYLAQNGSDNCKAQIANDIKDNEDSERDM